MSLNQQFSYIIIIVQLSNTRSEIYTAGQAIFTDINLYFLYYDVYLHTFLIILYVTFCISQFCLSLDPVELLVDSV